MKNEKIILPILIFVVGIFGTIFVIKTKPESEPISVKEQEWVVKVMPVQLETLSPQVILYGRVESPRTVTLRVPSLSFITEVKTVSVLEGQIVEQGKTLIALDARDTQLKIKQQLAEIADIEAQINTENQTHANNLASLAHEKSLLNLAEKSLTRNRELQKRQVSSESVLDQSQTAVEQQKLVLKNRETAIKNHESRLAQLQAHKNRAQASLESTRLELERTMIKSPFSGIISTVSVAEGDQVRSGDALLTVYDTQYLEVRAQIPDRYRGQVIETLQKKQEKIVPVFIGSQSVKLQLDRISGQVNVKSGGLDCFFRVVSGENLLRLGQFISLSLPLAEQSNVVALPFEAVYGKDRIYKLVDGRMRKLIVEKVGEIITAEGKSKILVRNVDLHVGEEVIITQLPNAMDGLKVKVEKPTLHNS